MSDVCKIATECHTNISASCSSHTDNKTTSLSPQLTAAGTNGVVLTPPPRPLARDRFSFDSHTKADQSAKHGSLQTKTTHLIVACYTRQGVCRFSYAGALAAWKTGHWSLKRFCSLHMKKKAECEKMTELSRIEIKTAFN